MQAKRCIISLIAALVLLGLPIMANSAFAHAILVRSEPVANAQLAESPAEIRIWFSEPLEPTYSYIELRDATGNVLKLPPSYVDPADEYQLVLMTGDLGEGLYTVAWRNVSTADGHSISGSYAFVVGGAAITPTVPRTEMKSLDPFNPLSRWLNLIGLALAVGSITFLLLVWQPTRRALALPHTTAPPNSLSALPSALWRVVWIGWIAAGLGAGLSLLNQAAILLGSAVGEVLTVATLWDVLESTRFGTLWLWRMGLWLLMGLCLLLTSRSRQYMAWFAMISAWLMLLPISLFSHAAASHDVALAIASDWVHLLMTTVWFGGLVQFLVAIALLRGQGEPYAAQVGTLTAYFSNTARVAVVALLLTGVFATWQQVNTIEGLTDTLHGQLLGIKLLLALPLLGVAGINLVWTQRRLAAGAAVWVGRLRWLVGVEIFLLALILLAVGGMTSVSPARNEIAQREAAAAIPPAPEQQPIHEMGDAENVQIHFSATPGWVGNSTFTIQVVNADGSPVTNVSLIRLRFNHQTQDLGESELQIRPEAEAPDGVYSIEGANLSTVGDWRVRITVQRPKEYDAIVDFAFNVIAPPPAPQMPVVESNPILPNRQPLFLAIGIASVLAGVFFLWRERWHIGQRSGWLASILMLLGLAFGVIGWLG